MEEIQNDKQQMNKVRIKVLKKAVGPISYAVYGDRVIHLLSPRFHNDEGQKEELS